MVHSIAEYIFRRCISVNRKLQGNANTDDGNAHIPVDITLILKGS